MKRCSHIQQTLRDRFDLGEALDGVADEHITTCSACRAYRADLLQLTDELGVFELDIIPVDLSATIIQHVRERGVDHGLRFGDYVSIALIAGAASIAAGWYMPASIGPTAWWSHATAWLAQASPTYSAATLIDRFAALRTVFDDVLPSIPMTSQPIVWAALAVSCLGAIAFNGYVAMHLRTAGD